MKKHLIAAAVAAAVAVPAMAQVTISGVIDTGYKVSKDQVGLIDIKRNQTGQASSLSTSVLNFSASEDLGGGLTARAFHNVGLNSNTGGEAARDTWASIGGGFGELKIGRFALAFESNAGIYSNGSNTVVSAGTADFMYGGSAVSALAAGAAGPRVNYVEISRGLGQGASGAAAGANGGALQYTSPRIAGGITVTVGFADSKIDNTTITTMVGETQVQQKDLAINYSAGPFAMGLALFDRRDNTEAVAAVAATNNTTPIVLGSNAVAATQTEREGMSFGLSYNMGSAIVRMGHVIREDKLSGSNDKIIDAVATSVGLTIPMGANTFSLNVYDGDDSGDGVLANQRDHEGFQLLAVHALSKRTSLYGLYGKNEFTGPTVATTSSKTDFALGLRHSF